VVKTTRLHHVFSGAHCRHYCIAYYDFNVACVRKRHNKASQLLHQLSSDVFVISMVILDKTLAVNKGLSEILQMKDYDLVQCIELVTHASAVLQGYRNDLEVFNRWFAEAEELLGNDIHKPRVVGRQIHHMRANPDAQDARANTSEFRPSIPIYTLILSSVSWMQDFLL
jgi:hypothetical protein